MEIVLYKSSLCPRCFLAGKYLAELLQEWPEIRLEVVDVIASPRRSFKNGIRMIPAVTCGEHQISGLFLNRSTLRRFLEEAADEFRQPNVLL